MSQGRGRAALGQIFWGLIRGTPTFLPLLPSLCWTHTYFPPAWFGWPPKAALLLYSAGRQGAPFQLHAQAPAHVKGFLGFDFSTF